MSSKQKRNRFSVDLKYKIIKLIDNKTPFDTIVDQFKSEGIRINNIYKFKAQRHKIIDAFENRSDYNIKSIRKSSFQQLDKALVRFVCEQTSNGVEVNSSMLKEKAEQLAQEFGYDNFKNSNGFADAFRNRYSRFFPSISRRTKRPSDCGQPSCDDCPDMIIPQLIQDYEQNYSDSIINDSNETMSEEEEEEIIDLFDALESVSKVRQFVTQSNCSELCFDLLNKLENELYKSRVKSEFNN